MIRINPTNNYNPNFKEYKHEVLNKSGRLIYRGDTCLFRKDLELNKLIRFLELKYQNIPKVNIVAHACSDGEEAYSFISKLLDTLGVKQSLKYLPISAHDIDIEHLEQARRGKYKIKKYETIELISHFGNRFNNYFDLLGEGLSNKILSVKDVLKQHVTFKESNIVDDAREMPFKHSVLFARNVWPYLGDEGADKLAMYLSQNMDSTSTLVIGDFDKMYNIDFLLHSYGFKESYLVDNVFEKQDKKPVKQVSNLQKFFKKIGLIN